MSKKIVFGMIALLSVSLFFLGCPTEADSDSSPTSAWPETPATPTPPPANPAQAAKGLADGLKGIIGSTATVNAYDNGLVTVSGGTLTFPTPVDIPADVTLRVASGGTLEVGTGTERLVVNGVLEVESGGTITVANGEKIEVGPGGTYILPAGANGTNNGTVIVKAGGTILSDANITGTGTNIVEGGGTVYFKDADDPIIGSSTNEDAIFQVPVGSKFQYNNDFYIVDGNVTLNKPFLVSAINEQLKITANSTLTLKAELKLRDSYPGSPGPVYGAIGELGSPPANPAKIVIADGGSINVSIGLPAGAPNESNFYCNNNGSPQQEGGTGRPDAGSVISGPYTYTWNANAGGSTILGWQRP
jgi:hypothetical protein